MDTKQTEGAQRAGQSVGYKMYQLRVGNPTLPELTETTEHVSTGVATETTYYSVDEVQALFVLSIALVVLLLTPVKKDGNETEEG